MKVQLYCCICVYLLLFIFCPFNFYLKDDFRSCCSHWPTLWARCVFAYTIHTVYTVHMRQIEPYSIRSMCEGQRKHKLILNYHFVLSFIAFNTHLMCVVCTAVFKIHFNESFSKQTVNLLLKWKRRQTVAIHFETVTSFTSAHAVEHREHNYGWQLR